jgi:DNA-binding MarR family transcriptional regulator
MPSHAHVRTVKAPRILECNLLPLRQGARQITRLYDEHLAPHGVTASQFVILALLYANPGMSMRELGDVLTMERSSLLRALKPLTRDGLVRTGRQAALGARQFEFQLSEAGEAKYVQATPLWRAAQQAFDEVAGRALSADLRRQLAALGGG